MQKRASLFVAAGLIAASLPASADDLLGAYAGFGIGESTVRSDNSSIAGFDSGFGYDGFYHDGTHHFAWKVMAGVRPIAPLGAELEYIDFGHPGSDGADYYYSYGPDSHPRALAAFAVGYLPLPVPFIDVYGKAGAARLHTNVDAVDGVSGATYSQSRWDTRFAYGVGVKSKIWNVSLHAEYERVSSPYGDPDLFSVSATWNF